MSRSFANSLLYAMRNLKLFALLLLPIMVGGCSILQGTKLLAPENAGFSKIASNLYVESGADEAAQAALRDAMAKAENAICTAYGSVNSRPVVHVCISEGCYGTFGGRGDRAKVYYGHLILLSPRGLNWHYIAHEWSHAEIFSRLTLSAWWWQLPQWFDEGIAVAVSEAPENSEAHWQFLVESNLPRPTREELYTFRSLSQWGDAVGRYGEKKNLERKAKGEPEIRPVYTAAGHELRPWLAKAGSAGLLRLIGQLNSGMAFEPAYRTADIAVERGAPRSSP